MLFAGDSSRIYGMFLRGRSTRVARRRAIKYLSPIYFCVVKVWTSQGRLFRRHRHWEKSFGCIRTKAGLLLDDGSGKRSNATTVANCFSSFANSHQTYILPEIQISRLRVAWSNKLKVTNHLFPSRMIYCLIPRNHLAGRTRKLTEFQFHKRTQRPMTSVKLRTLRWVSQFRKKIRISHEIGAKALLSTQLRILTHDKIVNRPAAIAVNLVRQYRWRRRSSWPKSHKTDSQHGSKADLSWSSFT